MIPLICILILLSGVLLAIVLSGMKEWMAACVIISWAAIIAAMVLVVIEVKAKGTAALIADSKIAYECDSTGTTRLKLLDSSMVNTWKRYKKMEVDGGI
jgi:hypothetical protein